MSNSNQIRRYPGKVLLFGEYTVLTGSRALAVPALQWFGSFTHGTPNAIDADLLSLARYIGETEKNLGIDHEHFMADVKSGLKFNSNIPQGFGLGSSAAISAAVLDTYSSTSPDTPLTELVTLLSGIEDHFHGHSSGMDPLVSFLNKPILHEQGTYHEVELPRDESAPQFYLLNSGINRFTAPLVKLFKSRLDEEDYMRDVIRPMNMHVDHAVGFLLEAAWEPFYEHCMAISSIEYSRFKEMLPESIHSLWSVHHWSKDLIFKLCGAGGGGFFMIIARPGVDVESEIGLPVVRIEVM